MRAEFLELTWQDRAGGLDLRAEVMSQTDGRKLATVLRLAASRSRFGSHVPHWICSCWPADAEPWDCEHVILVKAALEASSPRPAA